jgi:hypothetical protein
MTLSARRRSILRRPRAVEERDDVLVFTSESLREELEVTGRVRLVLYAESSAVSTDWVGRLCDVHPDGRSFNILDELVRRIDGRSIGRFFAEEVAQRLGLEIWIGLPAALIPCRGGRRMEPNLGTGLAP